MRLLQRLVRTLTSPIDYLYQHGLLQLYEILLLLHLFPQVLVFIGNLLVNKFIGDIGIVWHGHDHGVVLLRLTDCLIPRIEYEERLSVLRPAVHQDIPV
jgi:hypothetical protein